MSSALSGAVTSPGSFTADIDARLAGVSANFDGTFQTTANRTGTIAVTLQNVAARFYDAIRLQVTAQDQNFNAFVGQQSGVFDWSFTATPPVSGTDLVIGLSSGPALDANLYDDFGFSVRFRSNGIIDVRDFNLYRADVSFPYVGGQAYNFVCRVDMTAQTLTVAVNGTTIATSYQARESWIDNAPDYVDYVCARNSTHDGGLVTNIAFAPVAIPYATSAIVAATGKVSDNPSAIFRGRTDISDGDVWGVDSADAGVTITPLEGGDYTVTFAAGTPAGAYQFSWGLYFLASGTTETGTETVYAQGPMVNAINPRYLQWPDGRPLMFYGTGNPENFWFQSQAAQDAIINAMIADGGNTLYTMLTGGGPSWSGGDFTGNVFAGDDPSAGLDATKAAAIKAQLDICEANNIAVLILFCDDGVDPWGNGSSSTLNAAETQFIDDCLATFTNRNIIWSLGEEYDSVFSVAHASAWAAHVKANDTRNRLVGIHQNPGTTSNFVGNANVDIFICQNRAKIGTQPPSVNTVHTDYLAAYANSPGMHVGAWEIQTNHGLGGATLTRQVSWAAMMTGATVMVLRWFEDVTPTSAELNYARFAINFFESAARLPYMAPDDARAAGETDYVLAEGANSFIGYSTNAPNNLGFTGLNAASYQLTWLDCVSGATVTETVAAASGTNSFSAPAAFGSEIAVYGVQV